MPFSPTKLFAGLVAAASTTVYTTPAATKVIVKEFLIANTSAVAATITVTVAGTALLSAYSIPANGFFPLEISYPLVPGDLIVLAAGTTNVLTCHITGVIY